MSAHNSSPFKTVLVGDSGAGKSSIVEAIIHGRFSPDTSSTIGAAYWRYNHLLHRIDSVTKVSFDIWDTAGQERFMSLVPMYVKGARVVLSVYDAESQESFDHATNGWFGFVTKYGTSPIHVLVQNKSDLSDELTATGERFAAVHGILFHRTSAKTNEGIFELFDRLSESLLKLPPIPDLPPVDLVSLTPEPPESSRCGRC